MGAADIVPGVSGGTVALVLGHYQRLITAISHVDAEALRMLRERRVGAAFRHLDGRFLIALGVGIASGIIGLASLMHWLLEHRPAETMSVFFGLVLASGFVVASYVQRWSTAAAVASVAAAVAAYIIGTLSPTTAEPTLPYLFFCAMLAICAMILPGISGAFILLLLGVYHPVTGLVKDLAGGAVTGDGLLRLVVFTSGCAIGLALFSRFLRVLLDRHASVTYAALLGLMIGSLRKLWPLQIPTTETATLPVNQQHWVSIGPAEWDQPLWPLVALALLAAGVVLAAHWAATRRTADS